MPEKIESDQAATGSYIVQAKEGSTGTITSYQASGNITIYSNIPSHSIDPTALIVAQQQFAALPLDTIPAVAQLPTGSRMPFSRNPLFVGRQADLQTLALALKGDEAIIINQMEVAAAIAMGGMGKTQLASEFVHHYGQYFAGGVFWLNFADPNIIQSEIAECHNALGLEIPFDFGSLPLDNQVRLVLSAWQSPLPRLLVFDNCEDEKTLDQWRPHTGGCRILVTSRSASWSLELGIKTLQLSELNREESIALLHKYRADLLADDLDTIARELGDLPLALHLAGSFLKTYRYTNAGTPTAYLKQLQQVSLLHHPSLKGKGSSPYSSTGHVQNVERTFAVSYELLDSNDPIDMQALNLLACASYFAPGEPIPGSLLRRTQGNTEDNITNELQIEDALERIRTLGLLEAQKDDTFRLHRLLATFIQLQNLTINSETQEAVEQIMFEEAAYLNSTSYPSRLLALQPHLRIITETSQKRNDRNTANLCDALGTHLRQLGKYTETEPFYQQSLTIRQQVLGPQHPDTATSLNNLAGLYQAQGKYTEAEPLYQQALAIIEKTLESEHPITNAILKNYAIVLYKMKREDDAKNIEARIKSSKG
jgi:tetratricopeptide (TPR) repeat protein